MQLKVELTLDDLEEILRNHFKDEGFDNISFKYNYSDEATLETLECNLEKYEKKVYIGGITC